MADVSYLGAATKLAYRFGTAAKSHTPKVRHQPMSGPQFSIALRHGMEENR